MQRPYVAGFLIDETGRVALVRKARPQWQAGKLNAIGGKVEPGESAPAAMRREFHEETGVEIDDWEHFATVSFEKGVVDFFRSFVPAGVLDQVRTVTDEPIEVHPSMPVPKDALPNLAWLLPLALYTHDRYEPIVAHEIEGDNTQSQ
jgi:8-oxo-dGTP diphosphatase